MNQPNLPKRALRSLQRRIAAERQTWPRELLRAMTFALYAGQHLNRPESEQSDFTRKIDVETIAEAEAAYAAFRLAASR